MGFINTQSFHKRLIVLHAFVCNHDVIKVSSFILSLFYVVVGITIGVNLVLIITCMEGEFGNIFHKIIVGPR